MPDHPCNRRYDAALAAGLRILELFDRQGGDPKHVLLSCVTYTVLDAIREAEQARRPPPPSDN